MDKKIINSNAAPAPIGPYNHSVMSNGFLFVSGQIPYNEERQELVTSGIEDETRQVLANVGHILKEAGLGYENVVKATIFITDMSQFATINGIYAEYFKENAPARECVQVAALPRGVNIEISVIATVK